VAPSVTGMMIKMVALALNERRKIMGDYKVDCVNIILESASILKDS